VVYLLSNVLRRDNAEGNYRKKELGENEGRVDPRFVPDQGTLVDENDGR